MANYDEWKQKYSTLNDNQKQMWNDKISWMDANSEARQFTERYNQEMNNNQQSNNNSSNFNNQNGTNWQNQVQQQPIQQTANGDTRQNPNWVEKTVTQEEMQNSINEAQTNMRNQNNVSPELDQSKFNQDPWKITVQEWTAQQTGRPDYQANSEARLNEMKGNLDHYFATSPRMFSDRETFNKMFQYNERESEAQRQLLDSYWKRKEDMDKASTYTNWESINTWMKNWEITTDQLNLLKEYNPEAYRKWQQLQEDEIKKRIVNDIVPPTIEAISWKINWMIEALWIQAQDALDIEWIYNDTMTKVGAYQTLEDANRTVKEIEAITNKKTAIMNRYAASTWGTVSDALAAARMQKAIAPYNEQLQGLQYQYQDYSNLYSQKSATAYQAANVRALQANENQRIWNQKTAALWFAQTAMSYRTPEQQAQLRLQEQQAQNDMQLLQQSRLNDLNRYNQYATAKMQNQLQQELTDLSVEDENQLKANLNNALSDYYKNYGDIIQRSQAQAVDDIIAYAKKKGISVAQAMTENFIKPLQNKAEYKQKVATDYGMLSKQSIGTINWRSVIMTTNPNWSISYQYIDSWITDSYTIDGVDYVVYNWQQMTAKEFNEKYWNKVWTVKPYDMVSNSAFDLANEYWYTKSWTLWAFMSDPKNQEGQKWWQCASFVNDYLESIWVWRYFWTEDVKTRESRCNSDTAKVWTIAVFDYNHYIDWKNYGHVWIVVDTDENGFWVLDSNWDLKKPWVIEKRYIRYGSSSCKWFFDPSQPPRTSSVGNESETATEGLGIVTDNDIYNYNDATLNRKMSAEDRQKVLDARNTVYSDPNASIDEILRFSQWGKTPTDTSVQSLDKYAQALTSLGQLTDLLKDANTWPIIWALRSKNPYDKKAREINTAIAWLLPTLARWVYGEVWVLTDKDIEHYSQTVPNLRSTSEVNDAILAMSLDMLADGYKRKLQTQAALWYDVSGMKWIYDQIISKANQLKNNIWISDSATWPQDVISDIYSSAMNTNTSYSSNGWNASYGGYSSDFISQMIYSKL